MALYYGPFEQCGSIDGEIIKVEGKDIQLRDGDQIHSNITTTETIARELNAMLGLPVRLNGVGRWFRTHGGDWKLKSFVVSSYDKLKNTSLIDLVDNLRQVKGNTWDKYPAPLSEIRP